MVWRAAKNILPTNKRLYERGLTIDPICPQCGMEEETIAHVLLQCEETRRIWFASPVTLHVPVDTDLSFTDWISFVINKEEKSGIANVFNLIYALWKKRNTWVFDKKRVSIDETLRLADSWQNFCKKTPSVMRVVEEPIGSSQNAIVFIDAAHKPGVRAGFGCVVTDQEGLFLAAAIVIEPELMEPMLA
ncbi:hypothetical protein RIF29_03979 [Crotalaria pallida]|uniref:Reverse transcriptase zinc-binding domain-containing protein n=1 Tax=Crotalaria pallida TaxID=3830 RepID=A0AAN9J1X9_CROPI